MEKTKKVSYNDRKSLKEIAKALSSDLRIDILDLLSLRSMNVQEIADSLNIPKSTASTNINILEEADLIFTSLQPGKRGSMKQCSIKYESMNIELLKIFHPDEPRFRISEMPIGGYTSCEVHPTCGLIDREGFIGKDDDPKTFFSENRFKAQLLWFTHGYVEYKFPFDVNGEVTNLQFSLEICSEAPFYRKHWPSDITVWVNDVEIGTWVCPGDFGGRRGKYTPDWWPVNSSQFGFLKTWQIDRFATYIDGERLSSANIKKLNIHGKDYISFKIGIKPDARNLGGINIFGKGFGDYEQDIIMRIDYVEK